VDAAGLITAGLETLADRIPSGELHELEARLVGKAVRLAAHEVRRLVSVAVARADVTALREREKRQYAERFFAWAEDNKGMVTFTGRMDAVTAAPIRTVLDQVVTQQFRNRRDQDPLEPDKRTPGQMRADALFEMCRHALGCKNTDRSGVRTTVVVRMNKSELDAAMAAATTTSSSTTPATTTTSSSSATSSAAAPTSSAAAPTSSAFGAGVGSIDGTGVPVTVGELRRLAGDAGVIPAVLGGDSEILDLGRKVRMFTTAQRLALLERDGGCAKCHAPPEHCEAHHIRWWDQGGTTDLSNGVMLCTRCHHDIHRQHWDIHVAQGRVEFIPPVAIDPTRTPRPGGLAAITLTHSETRKNSAREDSAHTQDTPSRDPRENSAPTQDADTSDTTDNPAWRSAA
jgi:hypothetical protein